MIHHIIYTLAIAAIFILGAVSHESDLADQCKDRGQMNTFFHGSYECSKMKD